MVHEANNPAWICVLLHTCGERTAQTIIISSHTRTDARTAARVYSRAAVSVCVCFFFLPVNIHNNNVILYTSIRAGSTRDTDSYLRHGLSPTQQCTYVPEGGIFFLTTLACSTAVRGQQQYKWFRATNSRSSRAYSTGPTASSGRKTGKGRPRFQENKIIAGAAVILKLFNGTKHSQKKSSLDQLSFLFLISFVYS